MADRRLFNPLWIGRGGVGFVWRGTEHQFYRDLDGSMGKRWTHMRMPYRIEPLSSDNAMHPAQNERPRQYPTETVDCDRCDGMGEIEDDVFVWTRCYSCFGRGLIEVCAYCLDGGEECEACGV
jgi:hypothetical protein